MYSFPPSLHISQLFLELTWLFHIILVKVGWKYQVGGERKGSEKQEEKS